VKVPIKAPPRAYAYVRAIGLKICPSTPCMVNSGRNAASVMAVENRIALSTCRPLAKIMRNRSVHPGAAAGGGYSVKTRRCSVSLDWRLRKMFSTKITQESTMMPKSTAPIDKRFADSPMRYRIVMLNSSANGMLAPTMIALRRFPRKIHWMRNTSTHPKIRLCSTVCVVTLTSDPRS
jgi:hypothetical protein